MYLCIEIAKNEMNNKEPGYVYILTNPIFREDWVKIGKSSRPVDVRNYIKTPTAVAGVELRLKSLVVKSLSLVSGCKFRKK